ncbi:IS66-like element accessory protein TnpA [Pelagibius marinus]|uniref:IS66-like element accessory protein TnpA n=1 Tax=Pelagibius marinus TaxID=2762760 RepID=UPI001872FB88|nr:transposase [Pelagibius marinus]
MADGGKRKRRSYSTAFKRRVVSETLEPGVSVAAVARRHDLNANMVFLWRRDARFGPVRDAPAFLPVEIEPAEVRGEHPEAVGCGAGEIEIALASGHRLRLSGEFDVEIVLRLARGLSAP